MTDDGAIGPMLIQARADGHEQRRRCGRSRALVEAEAEAEASGGGAWALRVRPGWLVVA